MTLQTYDDLHEDAHRLHPDIVEAMAGKADSDIPWWVEYEIPAETNGWIYVGNPGALSTTHYWADRFPDPTEAVVIHHTPTHPQDETPDIIEAGHQPVFEEKGRHNRDIFFSAEGTPYRTPLYTRRRMFWQAVEAAIEWMEENPPG